MNFNLSACFSAVMFDTQTATNDPKQMIMIIVVYGLILAALYFFMIRPNSKRKKEEENMRSTLEIGDEITTIGGIVGRVVSINDNTDTMVIETGADRTKIKFKKWALSTIDNEKSGSTKSTKEKSSDSKK